MIRRGTLGRAAALGMLMMSAPVLAAAQTPAPVKAFAPDLTQWFPSGRVDKASYQASWTKYIGAGNRLDKVEVRDLRVQVSPAGDAAVATYILRITTRTVKGEVSTEDNQETDVLFKRADAWTIVHVNYAPARKP